MAQNDIRRLSVGNGRVIELKESAGALFARETSEWGFEEVFDLTTLPGYDAGRRATYRINSGNIERREAQEAAWEVVMAVADLALTPVEAGGGGGGGMTLVYAATIGSDGVPINEYNNGLSGTWGVANTSLYIFTATDPTYVFDALTHLAFATVANGAGNLTIYADISTGDETFQVNIYEPTAPGQLAAPFSVQIYTFPPAE